HYCQGTGKIIKDKCTTCDGAGRVKKNVKVKVSIPAGIDDGQQIRIAGKGEPGINGGPPGDLFVVIQVQPHEFFHREGDHIFVEMDITSSQEELYDKVEVPTFDGKVSIKISA